MNRIAITLALALVACTDAAAPTAEPSVAVALPERPELTLLYDGGVVVVLADDGTELCTISNEGGAKVDFSRISHECGLIDR